MTRHRNTLCFGVVQRLGALRGVLAVISFAFLLTLTVACSGDDDPDVTATPGSADNETPAVTATPEASATPTVTPTPTPEPTATLVPRPEANEFPDDLREDSLELLNQIAAARGIEEPEPVDMFLLTREQAREFYAPDDDDEDEGGDDDEEGPTPTPSPRPLDARQELYELLGLVPQAVEGPGMSTVEEEALDNLISIITGFYDSTYNAFYMIETINGGIYGALARSTIVHELTHALQYQTVDINRIAERRSGNFDATNALLSLMEGDAVNSELELLGYSTRSTLRVPVCFEIPAQRNPGTPYAIERELDVWYEDGLCFVQAVRDELEGGIEDIFEDLPETMEQILHPEKYLAGETAQPVAPKPLTSALGEDWRLLNDGTFGEFGLQNILLTGLPEERVRVQQGAAGWGGDAWDFYVSDEGRLLHLDTVWDTDADASEFIETLVASLQTRGFTAASEGTTITLTGDSVTWSLTHQDDDVTVLVTNTPDVLPAVQETLALQ